MSEREVLFQGKNPEGKIFVLYGSMTKLEEWADELISANHKIVEQTDEDDWSEYDINYCDKGTHDSERFTEEERMKDVQELQDLIQAIKEDGFKAIFLKCPRKKNGSLAKNRVTRLWRGETFRQFWEDSYGWNAPEVSVKNIDDYKAELELTSRVVGW